MSIPRLEPIYVPAVEAAAALGVKRYRMYELLNSGDIEGRYDGTRRLVSVRSLREYAESLPTEPPQDAS